MKRLLPFIILIVVLLAGIVSFFAVLSPERHRAEITSAISSLLKRPVVIGPMSMGYFPPTLRLSQVAAMKESGVPLVEIDSVSAPLDLGALFHLKFVPAGLQLNRPKLTVTRKVSGSWDLGNALPGAGGAGPAAFAVSWKAGEIHWVDPYGPPGSELVLSAVEGAWDPKQNALTTGGDFSGIASPAHLALSAKGQAASSDWSGDLQMTNHADSLAIHLENKAGRWEAKGASAKWPLANALALAKFNGRADVHAAEKAGVLEITNWQLHASGSASALSFEHSGGITGGLIEAKGTLETTPSGLHAHVDGAAKEVPADAFWAAIGQDVPLTGRVTFVAKDIQLALSSGTAALQSGQGYWELKEGRYMVPAAALKRLARAKTMPYIKKKFEDMELNGFPVARLSAHWEIKNGLASVDDGLLVSTNLKAGWAGKLDPGRHGMDLSMRLDIHEKNPKLLSLVPSRYQAQPAFGRLQGTLQDWTLRSVRQGRISAALQTKLRKAANQK